MFKKTWIGYIPYRRQGPCPGKPPVQPQARDREKRASPTHRFRALSLGVGPRPLRGTATMIGGGYLAIRITRGYYDRWGYWHRRW